MSTNVGSIHYDLGLDTSAFDRAANNIKTRSAAIGDSLTSVGKTMTIGMTLPIAAGMTFAVKAASDLNETLNKVDVAFKNQSQTVKDWSKTSIKTMGLAQQSALDAAALFGDMSTAMGLSTEQAAKMSIGLTQLGADLASFKNISFSEAQTALAGVFTGETESLKHLGIVMTQANLQAYALSQGITKNIQDMSQAELVQLRYAYILSVTSNAQGDFVRTSGGTANQMRMTQERFKQLSAELGANLLPIVNKILASLNSLMQKFSALSPQTQTFLLTLAGILAVVGPLLLALGMMAKGIQVLVMAFQALKVALIAVRVASMFLMANPIILAITVIILAIAALAYVIYRNWGTLVRWFKTGFNAIKDVVSSVFNAIAGFWDRNLKPVFEVMISVVKTILTVYIRVYAAILLVIVGTLSIIAKFIWDIMQKIWRDITTVWNAIYSVLSFVWGIIYNLFVWELNLIWGVISTVFNAIRNVVTAVWNAVYNAVAGPVHAIWSVIVNSFNAVWSFLSGISSRIMGIFSGFGSLLYNAGRSLIQGFLNGAGSLLSSIGRFFLDKVPSFIREPFKKALGIHSPSKVFEGFGKNTMQGFVNGITSMADAPMQAFNTALSGTLGKADLNANVMLGGNNQQTGHTTTIQMGDVHIADRQTADYFFDRLNRNNELTRQGLATL